MPTALIVEDEPQANKLLAMLLALRGYQTQSAFQGAEALEKTRSHLPDVVFLDLMLPDMHGYDVCRSIKASGSSALVPVVIVTARITAENRIASFGVGADDYIPKPYTPDQIFDALEQSQAWKDQFATPELSGQVPLDVRDDGETLRHLALLRRLMQARGCVGHEQAQRLSAAITALWSKVDAWSRGRSMDQVATLAYSLTPRSLTLTLHDEAGWLPESPELHPGRLAGSPIEAPFDQIIAEPAKQSLKLIKHFSTA
jgi:DNA-binding response OmpR family regulator